MALLAKQILLFYGDEEFLIQEKVNDLKRKVSNPDLNVEQLDAESIGVENIVNALQTAPLLLGERLLIIKNLDLKQKVWEALIPSLESLAMGTTVIFWASSMDKRSKFFKAINKLGDVYEFRAFADWEQEQVVAWIIKIAKALGKSFERSAAAQLQEVCGNNLRKLDSEINKIVTYVGERKTIKSEDVLLLASPGEKSVFILSDALTRKDLPAALSALRVLHNNKVDFFQLLGLLATNYRTMLQIKTFPKPNSQARTIAQAIGASPYFVKKCQANAVKFSKEELKNNLELLLKADLSLKSGYSQLATFELLIANLCQQKDIGKQYAR